MKSRRHRAVAKAKFYLKAHEERKKFVNSLRFQGYIGSEHKNIGVQSTSKIGDI